MLFSRVLGKLASFYALSFFPLLLLAQAGKSDAGDVPVHLEVKPGTPLRLYLTKRVPYRQGELVQAKLAESVWVFDRIVIPAGTAVEGQVTELDPVPNMERAMSMVRGDFTPLKRAKVSFTRMVLPAGRSMALDTQSSLGLATIFVPGSVAKKPKRPAKNVSKAPNSRGAQIRSFLKQQAQSQANARSRGLLDFVRGPNKREWVENYLWGQLPYHPQRYRSGTRFDAVLEQPLDFGTVTVATQSLRDVGTQPAPDSPALIRLTSTITSSNARVGEPIAAVLSEPLFSSKHQLVLPEGTQLNGKVTQARPARMFHRGGQLRFTFENVKLPPTISAEVPAAESEQAQLTDAEAGAGNLKIDSEGTAKATESKARFLRPIIAGLVAAKSMDNDAGKQNASGGAEANYSGRGLGGFSGFGLFGTAAVYAPRAVGSALGFYGLAWSAYSTVISRGREVVFEKNNDMAIRFGARATRR